MITANLLWFLINFAMTCEINSKLHQIEIEFHYGTYPSDTFKDDPRNNKDRLTICGVEL